MCFRFHLGEQLNVFVDAFNKVFIVCVLWFSLITSVYSTLVHSVTTHNFRKGEGWGNFHIPAFHARYLMTSWAIARNYFFCINFVFYCILCFLQLSIDIFILKRFDVTSASKNYNTYAVIRHSWFTLHKIYNPRFSYSTKTYKLKKCNSFLNRL